MRRSSAWGFVVLAAASGLAACHSHVEAAPNGLSAVAVNLHEGCEVEALSRKLAQFGLTASEPAPSMPHLSGEGTYTRTANAYVAVPAGYAEEWAVILSDIACVEEAWATADGNGFGHITTNAVEHGSIKMTNNAAAMLIKMDLEGDADGLAESLAEHIDGVVHEGTSVNAALASRDSAQVTLETQYGANATVDRTLRFKQGDKLIIAGHMITVVNCSLGSVRIYYSFEPVIDRMGRSPGGVPTPNASRKREAVTSPEGLDLVRVIVKRLAAAIRDHLETSAQAKPVLTDVRF